MMPSLPNVRNTFGIAGYDDILAAHIEERQLTSFEYFTCCAQESKDRQRHYALLFDEATEAALYKNPSTVLMISFQKRTDGCFAVARLPKEQEQQQ